MNMGCNKQRGVKEDSKVPKVWKLFAAKEKTSGTDCRRLSAGNCKSFHCRGLWVADPHLNSLFPRLSQLSTTAFLCSVFSVTVASDHYVPTTFSFCDCFIQLSFITYISWCMEKWIELPKLDFWVLILLLIFSLWPKAGSILPPRSVLISLSPSARTIW